MLSSQAVLCIRPRSPPFRRDNTPVSRPATRQPRDSAACSAAACPAVEPQTSNTSAQFHLQRAASARRHRYPQRAVILDYGLLHFAGKISLRQKPRVCRMQQPGIPAAHPAFDALVCLTHVMTLYLASFGLSQQAEAELPLAQKLRLAKINHRVHNLLSAYDSCVCLGIPQGQA